MGDPVFRCIFGQRRAVSDAALFNVIAVQAEQNAQASLRKNCMRRLENDMITRRVSIRGAETRRGQELFDRKMRELYNPGFVGFYGDQTGA
jgi:hypothetical protein